MNAEPTKIDRPVQNGEVFRYAKKTCKACGGLGQFFKTVGYGTIRGKTPERAARLCGCAIRRFMRAHAEKVTLDGETLFWKAP